MLAPTAAHMGGPRLSVDENGDESRLQEDRTSTVTP